MSPLPTCLDNYALAPLEWHRQTREWCHEMRVTQSITYDNEYGWLIFRHKDVVRVLSDHATYSSQYELPATFPEESRSILMMDPPRHQQLRSLLTHAFSARTITQMEPIIESIAHELLEKISINGQAEFMEELAIPFPIMIIAEMLGISREDWRLFKRWTDGRFSDAAERETVRLELASYFFSIIAERRKRPDDKLISLLLAAEVEGKHLKDQELCAFFLTLLVASNITTTNLLGNSMLCFSLFPEELKKLHQNPSLIPGAIEEILRYMGPERVISQDIIGTRFAKKDAEIGGQHIRKGDVVRPIVFSANFDEYQFDTPERLDIERNSTQHFTFGHGIHFCLGAPLARLEVRILFMEMIKRFSHWNVLEPDRLEQMNSSVTFGVKHLPMNFQSV